MKLLSYYEFINIFNFYLRDYLWIFSNLKLNLFSFSWAIVENLMKVVKHLIMILIVIMTFAAIAGKYFKFYF